MGKIFEDEQTKVFTLGKEGQHSFGYLFVSKGDKSRNFCTLIGDPGAASGESINAMITDYQDRVKNERN